MPNYLIYNVDNNRIEHFDGLNWQTNETAEDVDGKLNDYVKADGSVPVSNLEVTNNLIVGGSTQDASAILQAESTTKGLLPPRMSETQRDLISAAEGLMIYNLTTKRYNYHNGANWVVLDTGAGLPAYTDYVGGHASYVRKGTSLPDTINLNSILTEGLWESIGPTASGADNIWTALDVVPTTATALTVRTHNSVTGDTDGVLYGNQLHYRGVGSGLGIGFGNRISETGLWNRTAVNENDSNIAETTIPIDSNRLSYRDYQVALRHRHR